jgi:DNA-binding NtrC family response regulator
VERSSFDAALVDIRLPDMDGLELVDVIKREDPFTAVIVITGNGDVDTAVRAIQQHADHFVQKPFKLKAIDAVVERQIANYRRQTQSVLLNHRLERLRHGESGKPLLLPGLVAEQVRQLAENDATSVLICGETGTGKGRVAEAIHEAGPRHNRQLVDVNCAGLNPAMLESELFGHEKGAYTDAKTTKRGLFEIADGGSLFLDEVGDLPHPVQAKLLKFLEERRFRRLGATRSMQVDVRLITATHVDLEKAVTQARFRKDLYYRLVVVPLILPPLRERLDDIVPLAQVFIDEFNSAFGKRIQGLSPQAEGVLRYHHWPGNIRELRNVLERAVLLGKGQQITPADLPESMRRTGRRPYVPESSDLRLGSAERSHIRHVLEVCDGNRTQAAKILGIHRSTLISKISKYQLA